MTKGMAIRVQAACLPMTCDGKRSGKEMFLHLKIMEGKKTMNNKMTRIDLHPIMKGYLKQVQSTFFKGHMNRIRVSIMSSN